MKELLYSPVTLTDLESFQEILATTTLVMSVLFHKENHSFTALVKPEIGPFLKAIYPIKNDLPEVNLGYHPDMIEGVTPDTVESYTQKTQVIRTLSEMGVPSVQLKKLAKITVKQIHSQVVETVDPYIEEVTLRAENTPLSWTIETVGKPYKTVVCRATAGEISRGRIANVRFLIDIPGLEDLKEALMTAQIKKVETAVKGSMYPKVLSGFQGASYGY